MSGATVRWGIALVLAVAFTAFGVWKSERQGRLASVPNYDDAVYFLSATRLIESGRSEGLGGVTEELRSEGLHSAWAVGLAVAGFLVADYADWGPYAMNVFVVLGFLAALSWMWRELRGWEWGSGLVFFLATPFATLAVVEFRPDLAWAVAVGLCGVYGLVVPGYLAAGSWWRGPRVWHAVLCAVALLVKPSTFAMTLIVFAYSVGMRVVIESLAAGRVPWRAIGRTAWVQVLVVVVLTAVYAVPFGADTWAYFWTNSFGANEAIWRAPVSVTQKWLYYATGFGAANNLGWAGLTLLGVMVAAVAINMLGVGGSAEGEHRGLGRRGADCIGSEMLPEGRGERERASQRRRGWRGCRGTLVWVALGGLVLLTYLLSSGFGMKSPFLGGAFTGTFLFAGAWAWREVFGFRISNFGFRIGGWRRWGAVGLAVVAVLIWRWPPYAWAQAGESGRNFAAVEGQVIEVLEELPLRKRVRLLFTQSGPLMRENVEMWLLERGHRTSAVKGGFLPSVERFRDKLKRADVVFVQDPGMSDAFMNLPAERMMDELRETMRGATAFKLAGDAVGTDGKQVYVYVRKAALR